MPAFWKADFLCCFRAWEEGSVVESQEEILWIFVRKRLGGLSWDGGVEGDDGFGLAAWDGVLGCWASPRAIGKCLGVFEDGLVDLGHQSSVESIVDFLFILSACGN